MYHLVHGRCGGRKIRGEQEAGRTCLSEPVFLSFSRVLRVSKAPLVNLASLALQ